MMTQTSRAKARFASYGAMVAMLLLLAALFPEFRPGLFVLLAVLAGWWLRLDPVGPDGAGFEPEWRPSRWWAWLRGWAKRRLG